MKSFHFYHKNARKRSLTHSLLVTSNFTAANQFCVSIFIKEYSEKVSLFTTPPRQPCGLGLVCKTVASNLKSMAYQLTLISTCHFSPITSPFFSSFTSTVASSLASVADGILESDSQSPALHGMLKSRAQDLHSLLWSFDDSTPLQVDPSTLALLCCKMHCG